MRSLFRQALDVYQSLGNQQMEFQVRNDLGGALARPGNYDEAQSQLRRCVQLADSLQDRLMQQQAWFNTAEVSRRIGDSSAAVRESLEAARLAEELGDRDLTARAVDNGHALIDDGQGGGRARSIRAPCESAWPRRGEPAKRPRRSRLPPTGLPRPPNYTRKRSSSSRVERAVKALLAGLRHSRSLVRLAGSHDPPRYLLTCP